MEQELGFNPEQSIEKKGAKERKSISEFLGSLKKRITDSLNEIVAEDDRVLENFERQISESKNVTTMAGEYFRTLIPKSAKPPEREYEHKERPNAQSIQDEKFLARLRQEQKSRSLASFRKLRKEKFAEREQVGSGEYRREQIEYGCLERNTYTTTQEGGQNIIREEVENLAKEAQMTNIPVSFVSVQNRKTGITLDCSQLLPSQQYFFPSQLLEYNTSINPKTGESKTTPVQKLLTSYEGTKNAKDNFRAGPMLGVGYGDLTKPGGMLRLMHEVAHAWQFKYYEPYGRHTFESMVSNIQWSFWSLRKLEKMEEEGKVSSAVVDSTRVENRQKLAEIGITLDPEAYYTNGDEPIPEGKYKIHDPVEEGSYVVSEEEEVKKKLQGYVLQERDAWAHAIRTVRFLRGHGIDLEPEFKTLDDFRECVDGALSTYQASIKDDIEIASSRSERFLRLPKRMDTENTHTR